MCVSKLLCILSILWISSALGNGVSAQKNDPALQIVPQEFPTNDRNGTVLTVLVHNATNDDIKYPPDEFPKVQDPIESNTKTDLPPPREFPKKAENGITIVQSQETTNGSNLPIAPVEFPNENNAKILTNLTILKNLENHSSSQADTELKDLLKTSSNIETKNTIIGGDHNALVPPKNDDPKEAEWIEDGENTEDKIRTHNKSERLTSADGSAPLVQGQLAAILAGIFVVISVLAYVALLTWRRYLENRYGNREMLVNEEEFNDPNDMGHFSI